MRAAEHAPRSPFQILECPHGLDRPAESDFYRASLHVLGFALSGDNHHEDALSVLESSLSMHLRLRSPDADSIIRLRVNLANCLAGLERYDESIHMHRQNLILATEVFGESHEQTLTSALNLAHTLTKSLFASVDASGNRSPKDYHPEAIKLICEAVPKAQHALGHDHELTLKLRYQHAFILAVSPNVTLEEMVTAVSILTDTHDRACRVLGPQHPVSKMFQNMLDSG